MYMTFGKDLILAYLSGVVVVDGLTDASLCCCQYIFIFLENASIYFNKQKIVYPNCCGVTSNAYLSNSPCVCRRSTTLYIQKI